MLVISYYYMKVDAWLNYSTSLISEFLTDDPEHASDVEALSTSARSSEIDYKSIGVSGTSVDDSILISEEKAQKGVVCTT